jgi:2-keto-4-pentenoate hydratase/2-oxohepta-3-ene-1,7-dioic acid hydratase in catechol pathway
VIKQNAHLNEMVFDIPTIINFISSAMTLLPGDVILTGTPAGIGPVIPGEEVKIAIEGLGELTNRVSARG